MTIFKTSSSSSINHVPTLSEQNQKTGLYKLICQIKRFDPYYCFFIGLTAQSHKLVYGVKNVPKVSHGSQLNAECWQPFRVQDTRPI